MWISRIWRWVCQVGGVGSAGFVAVRVAVRDAGQPDIRGSGGRRTMVRRGVPLSMRSSVTLFRGLLIGTSRVPRASRAATDPAEWGVCVMGCSLLDLGDRPAEADELAGGGDRDQRAALLARLEPGPRAVQSLLSGPRDRDRFGSSSLRRD